MSKTWINENGDVVHPDAPQGSGGPGAFGNCGPLECDSDSPNPVPHPRSPAGRYLALNDEHKKNIKQRYSTRAGASSAGDDALNAGIKNAADALVGQPVVGSGECYDLANQLLTNAGAKSAPAFGKITDTADYQWGTRIKLSDVRGGDVLQFRDYKMTVTTVKTTKKTSPNGAWTEEKETATETQTRPHHTAVVSSNDGGIVTVVEQNVHDPDGTLAQGVRKNKLFLHDRKPQSTKVSRKEGDLTVDVVTTVKVTVSGKIHAYRPQHAAGQ